MRTRARERLDRLLDWYTAQNRIRPPRVAVDITDYELETFAERIGPRLWRYRGFELENRYIAGRGRQRGGPTWSDRMIDQATGQTSR